MTRKLILSSPLLEITISRLCQELIENQIKDTETVILGLQPRGIYFAERIAADMKANGGLITMGDLANYRAVERQPLRGTYRGYDIVSMPPPSSSRITNERGHFLRTCLRGLRELS